MMDKFEKAEKLSPDEYDGPMFHPHSDNFYLDLDHLQDEVAWKEEELPEYVWCAKPVDWEPDFCDDVGDQIYENFGEDAHDSIPHSAWEELAAFEKSWWAKYKPTAYEPDYSRCVILTSLHAPNGE